MSAMQTHYRTCNLCEAMCGIAIKTRNKQILSIKGDKQDPLSRGAICPKAVALRDLHEDPDRLKKPVMKTASGWQEISWNKAFDTVTYRIKEIQKKYGRNSVGAYLGNPNVHSHGAMLTALPFLRALRTQKCFSATSNDQLPHMLVCQQMYGHQTLFPIPDIDHTDLFICMGGNPMASNGSLMSAPGMSQRIKNIKARGGRFIVIDPRRTETAEVASKYIPIRPGTDVYLLLAMLHVKKTGIPAATIVNLAREISQTPRALIYSRMGTSTQTFGTLSTWLVNVINLLTGHIDQRGGMMFTRPAADMVEIGALLGQTGHYNRYQSRVRGLPEFSGELPSSTIAEEILTPGEGKIRAMATIAGNPVLSSPNGTTRHANIILPPTGPLEHSHYDLIFNMLTVRNVAKYSKALFQPEAGSRHDYQIFMELTRRLNRRDFKSTLQSETTFQIMRQLGADGLLDLFLRAGPYGVQIPGARALTSFITELGRGLLKPNNKLRRLIDMSAYGTENRTLVKGLSISTLEKYPHGIDLGALQPRLPERLYRPDKKIQLTPTLFLKDMERVKAERNNNHQNKLLLIGRRHIRSNNSWLHNSYRLVKGKNRCTLKIHPDDAKKYNLIDGDSAEVHSGAGQVVIAVEVSDDMMPGVVSIPHGWGHACSETRLRVANKVPGVSLNDITDESLIDVPSGTSVLNGISVTICAISEKKTNNRRKSVTAV